MCMPKEEAKSLVERLVESMDRLTKAVESMGQPIAPAQTVTLAIDDGGSQGLREVRQFFADQERFMRDSPATSKADGKP